ncbi:MAG: hypothetical protein HQL68_13155, partial [Magnetococcales bacterium]|nr:hypothetical protein [Magnetococcales bacterium]
FPEVTDSPASKNGYITFGAFNRLEKNNEKVYTLWAEILHRIPTATLIIKAAKLDYSKLRENVQAFFLKQGISNNRLILVGKTPRPDHLKAHDQIDIMLEPYPHSGGMTTMDSLYMGVPILTYENNNRFPITASILHILELDEWRAKNEDEYIKKAVQFSRNLNYLKTLRHQLRKRFAESALGNSQLYTNQVETVYRQLWKKWCDNV